MKNLFKNTEFIFGVTDYKKLPEDVGYEILLAGRSNAGKSSALNALTENKKLARISKTPGRTQSINIFMINENINLVDLPGYGYAKVSKVMRDNLGILIEEYIMNQLNLIHAYVLIDAKVGVKNSDIDMFDLISEAEKNFSIVFTKIDKCSKSYLSNLENSMQSLMRSYKKYFNNFFFTSTKKNEGIINIQKDINILRDKNIYGYNSRKRSLIESISSSSP